MAARIYKPAKTAMQSGTALTRQWVLDYEPESTKVIAAGGPVRAVLEVIGGTARKLGIKPGDRVAHAMFRGR